MYIDMYILHVKGRSSLLLKCSCFFWESSTADMTCFPGSVVDIEHLHILIAMTSHQQLPILAKPASFEWTMTGSLRGGCVLGPLLGPEVRITDTRGCCFETMLAIPGLTTLVN